MRTSLFYVQKGKWLMINSQDLIKSGIMTDEDLRDLESEIEVKKKRES